MSAGTPFQLRDWLPRPEPLAPTGVAARGDVARRLARRLLAAPEKTLAEFQGVVGGNLLLLLGPSDSLPWADGVLYLGRSPEAPSLLVPTTLRPDCPLDLFERALCRKFPELKAPIAVLPGWNLVLSLANARTVSAEVLRGWLERSA